MQKLIWTTEKRKISDLKDHPSNPRTLSKASYDELIKSFKEFDYVELVAIDTENTILAGHQRIHIMKDLGWLDKEIEVRFPSRKLTEKESKKYLLRSNKNIGDWDFDLLANDFQLEELLDVGFTENELIGNFELENDPVEQEVELSDGEKLLTQVTFTLSNEQEEVIQKALKKSKSMGEFPESVNENSNGNALFRIVDMWISENGIS